MSKEDKKKQAALYLDQLENAIVRIDTTGNMKKDDVLKALKACHWLMHEWLKEKGQNK